MKRNPVYQLISLTCLLGAVCIAIWYIPNSTFIPRASKGPLLHEETSDFSKIRVRGDEKKRHLLFVSDAGVEQLQSTIDLENPGDLQVAYTKTLFASLFFKNPQKRMLVIGLGGGGMIRFIDENFPDTTVEAVEIDPAVVRLAAEYFETKPKPGVVIHTEDAFEFLARSHEPFDAIYLDAFLRPSVDGDPEGKTARLKTEEFLATMRDQLSPDGILACNLILWRSTTSGDLASLRKVFPSVVEFRVPGTGNLVAIASRTKEKFTREELATRAAELESLYPDALPFAELVKAMKATP
ncbi:MAG: fused MFS/spermidine synthase [Verrucomicrobiales bacterium]|nr:fused MFS/spermidine synthase [Verrucomicrobiales bacterium]